MDWSHLWFCINATHDGHSGCSDLLWLNDALDVFLTISFLGYIIFSVAAVALDEWRRR